MKEEEKALISRIKAGEEQAFEYIFYAYYPTLCHYAQKLLGDIDQARELAQDIFVKLYEKRQQLIITTSIKSYLFKAVHNSCLNYLKQLHLHNRHHAYLAYPMAESTDMDAMLEAELEERLARAISKLPGQCQKIFTMNRFEGKTNKEIAHELDISIRTVETQISKALHILRTELADLLTILLPLSFLFI
ncbi:RNA polymerase sigma-70 factor [Rhodocytophaga aerolata]|uniref:RNA polymerase sigma-70 factor n=1 Tax=Rhodocytophaga aerolata TaxID=455078 RepID=A0ABT8RJK9_9BACT|nr:RNA polymerase sigma-70 factor [Rhodocytophaga aerolata]MDO1451453.1 RNA polymerase sigma-70 factor [Rhodocytophaga aerolata]